MCVCVCARCGVGNRRSSISIFPRLFVSSTVFEKKKRENVLNTIFSWNTYTHGRTYVKHWKHTQRESTLCKRPFSLSLAVHSEIEWAIERITQYNVTAIYLKFSFHFLFHFQIAFIPHDLQLLNERNVTFHLCRVRRHEMLNGFRLRWSIWANDVR